jgi:hypothetical protein
MSSIDQFLYRLRGIALAAVVGVFVSLAVTPAADAHGTLNLYGKTATANRSGTLTLTIPHGCGSNDTTTTKIVLTLGSAWQSAKPTRVTGWKSTVTLTASGKRLITWTATGSGLPNNESGDFPVAVRWPKKAGIYNTPTAQYCGSKLMNWKDPFSAAADGDQPYPAVYPVPRVRVHSASMHSRTAVARSAPLIFCPLT